ncbi:MAG TPA: methyltransferase domain-containing protein [Anaerolineae bacterium]|nr:methyltransferase domain-containing protein [Anaerolineae bacterium]
MHTYLIDMLECPACHAELAWKIGERAEKRIITAKATCQACAAIYSVRDGIGLFLTPDLSRNDLWERMDSGLVRYLREHPDLERQLLEPPLEKLNPADQFFRAMVLEAHGNYQEARAVEEIAMRGLYTPEYLTCWTSQFDYVIAQLATTSGPIVDLASGRCYLVETLANRLQRPVVATDFSPTVLRHDRYRLEHSGVYDAVSLLAFDARHTPFKTGSVATLTTNLGLPNIEAPGALLTELRRIVDGVFLAISHFYAESDVANAPAIRAAQLDTLLYKRSALQHYRDSGWEVDVKNARIGAAQPTPHSEVLEGASIDGLPAAATDLEWCVLRGT